MSITLKHITLVVGLALALSVSAFAQATDQPRSPGSPPSAQQPATPSSQAPGQQQKPSTQADTARGELVSVDTAGKMLTIKMANGTEQKVQYNDDTDVTGERGGIAGLGKMSGRQVIVHFDTKSGSRVAREIEVQAAGASPGTTPSTRPGDRPGGAGDRPGGTSDRPGGAGDRPGGGADDRPGGAGAPGGDKPSGGR